MNRLSLELLRAAAVVGICAALAAAARAQGPSHDAGEFKLSPPDFSFRYTPTSASRVAASTPLLEEPEIEEAVDGPPPFGAKHSEFWTFGAGVAYNFEDAWDLNLRVAFSHFLIDDVELSFEVNGWYFVQDGSDALGLNPSLVFRWHLFNPPEEAWSIFADAGIGLLFATRNVPSTGTWFDFTPRIGAGYTQQISQDGTRFQFGVRWHHISNARIRSDRRNPARDGLMLYGGIMVPF